MYLPSSEDYSKAWKIIIEHNINIQCKGKGFSRAW